MSKEKVNVTVQYVGFDDYVDQVPAETVFQAIKAKAMHKFDLEAGSAHKYVLQHNNVNISNEQNHIATIGLNEITLTLSLKGEVNKG